MKPRIGIPVVNTDGSHYFGNYVKAIEEYGGEIILLIRGKVSIEDFTEDIDGLLLAGCGDIDPVFYDEEMDPRTKSVNVNSDELEFSLYEKAIENDLPVFGICRGIQVMNVATGGNLHQHISSHARSTDGIDEQHVININLEQENILGKLIGSDIEGVNSDHHQAVKDVGKGFVVIAHSDDDIIEAIQDPSKRFVIGVQYHPERMTTSEKFKEHRGKLFKAFIKAASE